MTLLYDLSIPIYVLREAQMMLQPFKKNFGTFSIFAQVTTAPNVDGWRMRMVNGDYSARIGWAKNRRTHESHSYQSHNQLLITSAFRNTNDDMIAQILLR